MCHKSRKNPLTFSFWKKRQCVGLWSAAPKVIMRSFFEEKFQLKKVLRVIFADINMT